MKRRNISMMLVFVIVGLMLAVSVQAGPTLGFVGVTNNLVSDVMIGEAQMSVTVDDLGSGQVGFLFANNGPDASSICDIYFNGEILDSIDLLIPSGSGVAFSPGAKPGNLPGGKPIGFSAHLSANSDKPVQPNGVSPGESLNVIANLSMDYAYEELLAAVENGDLRIGIHVQGFASDGSESFLNNGSGPPPPVIPVPGAILLAGLGTTLVVGSRRARLL